MVMFRRIQESSFLENADIEIRIHTTPTNISKMMEI
jgi:hypothetical protein